MERLCRRDVVELSPAKAYHYCRHITAEAPSFSLAFSSVMRYNIEKPLANNFAGMYWRKDQ